MLQLRSLDPVVPIARQSGQTQHRGIGGIVFPNSAGWESVAYFRQALTRPDFVNALAAYPSSAVAPPHLFAKVAVANRCTR